jgi:hypothetical protein
MADALPRSGDSLAAAGENENFLKTFAASGQID